VALVTGASRGMGRCIAVALAEHGHDVGINFSRSRDEVALDFPELKIILAHFGFPWVNQAISVVWIRRNCYLELSGWSPKYIPETVWNYARSIFPDRVLFGTDAPVMTAARWLEDFRPIPLPDEVKHKILYQNAHQLLFGGGPTPAEEAAGSAAGGAIPG